MPERSFVMLKPDAVQRRLVGRILQRFEEKGLSIVGLKMINMSRAKAEDLYSVHKGRPFYETLVAFVTASPVVVMAVEGNQAIAVVRKLLGATFGFNAEPGTIRGDFGSSKGFNLIHGSDSPESAARELPIFFSAKDLVKIDRADLGWVLEEPERA
jgi:nucleoside-diphosphate kinase